MIAAIAKVHQLTVVTRNVVDFNGFDVPLLNPFASRKTDLRPRDWSELSAAADHTQH